ncbi:MAG: hypothetical protein JSW62_04390 [Thermoplasmatales archaeon]|nr:MAG: hypothetical protein JSW62_04390 [Thermoplasmatales archaeon]
MKFFLIMIICSSVSKSCGAPMNYHHQFEDWSTCIKRGGELIVEFVDQTEIEMNKERLYVSYYCDSIDPKKKNEL